MTRSSYAISLVHGARIPPKEPRWFRPDWPERVARFFTAVGVGCVQPYFWSGDLRDALSEKAGHRYADHIAELHVKVGGPVFIICKSLGFAVAESGLTVLAARRDAVPVSRMIRIVPPDGRRSSRIPLVRNVIDFASAVDLMHLAWTPVITAMIASSFLKRNNIAPANQKLTLNFSFSDHTMFNFDHTIANEHGAHSVFHLYDDCLFGDLSSIKIKQGVIRIAQGGTGRQIDDVMLLGEDGAQPD